MSHGGRWSIATIRRSDMLAWTVSYTIAQVQTLRTSMHFLMRALCGGHPYKGTYLPNTCRGITTFSTMASTKRSVKLSDVGSGQYYGGGPLWGPRSSPACHNVRRIHRLNLTTSDKTWLRKWCTRVYHAQRFVGKIWLTRRQPVGFRLPLEGLLPSKQETSIKGEVMWRSPL